MKLCCTIIMIYSITSIELMLQWNHISDVDNLRSAGQLIPFVIGLVCFLKVFIDARHKFKVSWCINLYFYA